VQVYLKLEVATIRPTLSPWWCPGVMSVTWTPINDDGFKHTLKQLIFGLNPVLMSRLDTIQCPGLTLP